MEPAWLPAGAGTMRAVCWIVVMAACGCGGGVVTDPPATPHPPPPLPPGDAAGAPAGSANATARLRVRARGNGVAYLTPAAFTLGGKPLATWDIDLPLGATADLGAPRAFRIPS